MKRSKPVEQISIEKKPERQIPIGHRIYKTVGLRWVPTGKIFTSIKTKASSEPPNGSNEDITNLYECEQTLNVSAANYQSTTTSITPTTIANSEENNTDIQAEDAQIDENEFYNIFSTPVHHPLEQVRGNPYKPMQTRRQLATDPEMCMFALTVSTAELKNIKEAMADSAWIEAMQDELHQFD
ncbi:hypothetical protein Tco_0816317 [Tanacetum coccineum]